MSFVIWGRFSGLLRILTGYAALAGMAGVVISGSRGGYLSLTVGILVVLLLSMNVWKRLNTRPVLVGVLVAVSILLFLGAGLFAAFHSSLVGTRVAQINDPGNMRLLLWRAAMDQFHLSPLWGTGGFSYLHYGRLFRDPSVQNDPIHVHNDYLQLLADYGVVGATLFVIMLLLHVRSGFASFQFLVARTTAWNSPLGDRLALNIGCQAALAAYMVHSVVDFNMQLPLNALMMASIFAVLVNPGSPREEVFKHAPLDWIRIVMRWSIPVLGICFLIYELPMIRGELYAERSRVALRDGHAKESLELALAGLSKATDNPELYYDAGEAALELSMQAATKSNQVKLSSGAAHAFTLGLKLFPTDSRLAIKLAQALASSGDYSAANQTLNRAEQLDPSSSFVAAYRGLVEYSFGHLDEAELAFNRSLELGGEAVGISNPGLQLIEQRRLQMTDASHLERAYRITEPAKTEGPPLSTSPPLPEISENGLDLKKSQIPNNTPEH
jgi:tetratricopeptide (TPR) repeat protein